MSWSLPSPPWERYLRFTDDDHIFLSPLPLGGRLDLSPTNDYFDPLPFIRLAICVRLTDGDFVVLAQHDVVRGQVSVKDPLLFVQIPQCQHHLLTHTHTISHQISQSSQCREKSCCRYYQRSHKKNWSSRLLKTSQISSTIIWIHAHVNFLLLHFFPPTCINMFQILSSGNFIFFSFRELKCSPIGAPSISSITMYNFCSAKKKEKIC